jgi:hypothetical protein
LRVHANRDHAYVVSRQYQGAVAHLIRGYQAERSSRIKEQPKRLNEEDHRLLATWASDCAEHVLRYFEELYPEDNRPGEAIEAARAWVRGDLSMVKARKAALASHAAAREANNEAAKAAARAAGHAAATTHAADHARHAASYAIKAATAAEITSDATVAESDWQYRRLPEHLRPVAFHPKKHQPHPEGDLRSERECPDISG